MRPGLGGAARIGRVLAVPTVLALLVLPGTAFGASTDGVASGLASQPAPAKGLESTPPDREFVPGELIVRFKPRLSNAARTSALRAEGASLEEELALPGAVLVRLPAGRAVAAAATAFERRPEVLYAEPNLIHHLTAIPNDTRFDELWGLHQSSDADIDAPEAWDVTTGSSGVIVAVVDSGVASDHPDLAPNIWTNDDPAGGGDDDGNGFVDDTHGWDFIQDDNTPFDYNGHGTHVAGTIGAQGNNGQGVPGVNWDVSLMALRGADAGGNLPTTAVVNSFGYACANGAKVVNGSFTSSSMSVAISDAVLACPGVLFVFGAGNDAKDLDGSGVANDAFPCELHRPPTNAANVLCVGATDQDDILAPFSNHGTQAVHLAAPGVDILSTWPAYDAVPSTPDDFETDIAGRWTPTGTWARTTEASASPTHSITDSPGGLYANNANMTITKVDPFDLSGKVGCRVDYQLRLETQIGFDILRLDSSTDGINWTQIIGWSGSSLGQFIPMSDDLSSRDGSPTVYFRYRFTSNSTVQGDGAHIDDFSINCLNHTGEDYNTIDSTSMATAHVAGVAALLLAQDGGRIVSDLKSLITENVDAMSSLADKAITQGRLNACRAVGGTDTECGEPPTLQLEQGSYSFDEDEGTVSLTVVRSGFAGSQVSVDYNVTGGTATPDTDFSLPFGTLTFIAGDSSETIDLTITNDSVGEPAETIEIELSLPSGGAILGSPDSTTVTIKGSDQRPDGKINLKAKKGYVGNDIYNSTGRRQTKSTTQEPGKKRVFYVRVQNDGQETNDFQLKGSKNPAGATVKFFRGTSSTNITQAMRSGAGYQVTLDLGKSQLVRVETTIKSGAVLGSLKKATVTAIWDGDAILKDVVKAVVKVVSGL